MNYKVNEKVIHKTGGVCIINDIKVLNYGSGDVRYFCLIPYIVDSSNQEQVIYVPEDHANDLMRPILSFAEAKDLIEVIKSIQPIWYSSMKERKEKFSALLHTGKLQDICLVLKSLYAQQRKLALENRSLTFSDYDYLNKLKKNLEQELSLSLCLPLDEIENRIKNSL